MRLCHWFCFVVVLCVLCLVNQEADAFFTARAAARQDARQVSRAVYRANLAAMHAGGCSGSAVVPPTGCQGGSVQVIRSTTIVHGNGCMGGAGCQGAVPMAPKIAPGK